MRPEKLSTLTNGDVSVICHVPFERAESAWALRKMQHLLCRVEIWLEEGE